MLWIAERSPEIGLLVGVLWPVILSSVKSIGCENIGIRGESDDWI